MSIQKDGSDLAVNKSVCIQIIDPLFLVLSGHEVMIEAVIILGLGRVVLVSESMLQLSLKKKSENQKKRS